MKCVLSAINQAAPRAQDLYAYPYAKRDKDTPSNIGRKVVLRGLVSRQDLNGCYASIIEEPRCNCHTFNRNCCSALMAACDA